MQKLRLTKEHPQVQLTIPPLLTRKKKPTKKMQQHLRPLRIKRQTRTIQRLLKRLLQPTQTVTRRLTRSHLQHQPRPLKLDGHPLRRVRPPLPPTQPRLLTPQPMLLLQRKVVQKHKKLLTRLRTTRLKKKRKLLLKVQHEVVQHEQLHKLTKTNILTNRKQQQPRSTGLHRQKVMAKFPKPKGVQLTKTPVMQHHRHLVLPKTKTQLLKKPYLVTQRKTPVLKTKQLRTTVLVKKGRKPCRMVQKKHPTNT